MIFVIDIVLRPKDRQQWFEDHDESIDKLPEDLQWIPVPSGLIKDWPESPQAAKETADNLSTNHGYDVHVWSNLTPGQLWYHSYHDGRRGSGWPSAPPD